MVTLTFTDRQMRFVAQLLEAGAAARQAGNPDPALDLALENINAAISEALKEKNEEPSQGS